MSVALALAVAFTVAQGPFVAERVALSADREVLVSGVFAHTVVQLHGGEARPFIHPGDFAPLGALFGMASDPARNRLWIAETSAPYRIPQLTLSADETSVEDTRVLANGPPAAADVCLGVVRGNDYIYVRNSQWASFDGKGARTGQPAAQQSWPSSRFTVGRWPAASDTPCHTPWCTPAVCFPPGARRPESRP